MPGRPFTLRHLLQHRAGLPDYGALAAYHAAVAAGETPWTPAEMLRRVRADTLLFEPGHGWRYSNIGYLLVRNLVEHAAGAPLGTVLDDFVFAPLGVAGPRLATLPGHLDQTAWANPARYHPGWVYHGLLIGSAADAALLLHRLLADPRLAAMCSLHPVGGSVPGRPWQNASYGLGLMSGTGTPPGHYIGHTGGGPGSTAAIYQRRDLTDHPPRTAAAFAPLADPGPAERHAMALASQT